MLRNLRYYVAPATSGLRLAKVMQILSSNKITGMGRITFEEGGLRAADLATYTPGKRKV